MVEWYEKDSWATWLFDAKLSTILVTLLVAFSLPLMLHLWLYRHRTPINTVSFVLVGPSGAGKTSLLTALETGRPASTHPSQTSHRATLHLPEPYVPFSARYRAKADPTNAKIRQFALTDTPGHGKLRAQAFRSFLALPSSRNLGGILFVVDAAALATDRGLSDAAEHLHDVLLTLQQRYTSSKTSKGPKATPVLVAANKLDLFTALPAQLVRARLEQEVEKVRTARAKGILDVGASEDSVEEEHEWLGGGGEGRFEFKQMEEMNVPVEVVGGSVLGEDDGPDVGGWWQWIAAQM